MADQPPASTVKSEASASTTAAASGADPKETAVDDDSDPDFDDLDGRRPDTTIFGHDSYIC
jgi:hypothetical protein